MAITDLNITNQADSLLVGSINNVDDPVTFSITPGDGDLKFPSTAGGKYYRILAIQPDGDYEIMMVTSRTSDSMTADRELEGTTKLAFAAGAAISHRLTAQDFLDYLTALASYMPLEGGTFTDSVTFKLGADVASAAALAVDIPGNIFDITGTATVTSMNAKGVGTVIVLEFDGACTLTHHATDLVLPSKANIVTAAGDMAVFVEYTAGKWRCVSYSEAGVIAFYATQAGDQSVSDFTVTKVNFTTEAYDYGGNFASSVFTAPATDNYDFSAIVGTSTSFGFGEVFNVFIKKNGTAGTTIAGISAQEAEMSAGGARQVSIMGVPLVIGDTVEVAVEHSHSPSATIDGNGSATGLPMHFSGRKVKRV